MLKIAFLGFGNVGQGLASILVRKKEYLKEKYDFEFKVVGIATNSKGSVCCPGSDIDLEKILKIIEEGGTLADFPGDIKMAEG